jgi:serine/threonine-protein kinase RsbW
MGKGGDGPGTTGSFALEVPPEADQVRTARLFASAVARHFGADEDRVEDLKVAISEAATNSINAHRKADISDPVRIAAATETDGIRFSVIDAGPGFSTDDMLADMRSEMTPAHGLFEGSLGLTLIRTLFPGVQITQNADRGMTVTFVLETTEPVEAG